MFSRTCWGRWQMPSGGSPGIERGVESKCSFPLASFSSRYLRPQLLSPGPLPAPLLGRKYSWTDRFCHSRGPAHWLCTQGPVCPTCTQATLVRLTLPLFCLPAPCGWAGSPIVKALWPPPLSQVPSWETQERLGRGSSSRNCSHLSSHRPARQPCPSPGEGLARSQECDRQEVPVMPEHTLSLTPGHADTHLGPRDWPDLPSHMCSWAQAQCTQKQLPVHTDLTHIFMPTSPEHSWHQPVTNLHAPPPLTTCSSNNSMPIPAPFTASCCKFMHTQQMHLLYTLHWPCPWPPSPSQVPGG